MALGPGAASTGAKIGFKILGQAASAAYGAVAGTAKALGAVSGALNSASQDLSKQKPQKQESPTNVIYVNFGMAGSAGKQRVTGGGTLPAVKNVAKPQVSEKMPTEALLDTAVKYLTSIDKSLKAQLDFEKKSYEQQVRDERESIVEEKKSSFNFSDIKDRLSGLKSSAQDAGSTLATIAKFAAGLGAAAALAAASLDTKQLEELKANIDTFTDKFSFLSEIPNGGLSGFLVGLLFGKGIAGRLKSGVKFGLLGILTSAVADTIFSRMTGGEISEDTRSLLNIGAAGAIGYLGYRGIKSASRLSTSSTNFVGNKIYTARTALELAKGRGAYAYNAYGASFHASGDGRRISTSANFLASSRWRNFLAWLSKNGRRQLVRKIETRIAIALASGALAATGVGAVVGVLGILLNVLGSIFLAYEIYQLWQEWTSQEGAESAGVSDDAIAAELNQPADATRISGTTSFTPSTNGTALPPAATGSIDAILNKTPQELTDAELRQLVERQGRIENPSGSLNNPGGLPVASARTTPYAGNVVGEVGANGNPSIRIASFDTAENGTLAAMWLWRNGSHYRGKSVRDGLGAWSTGVSGRNPNYERMLGSARPGYEGTSNPITGSSTGGGFESSVGAIATAGIRQVGQLLGTLGSAVIKPGIARSFEPTGGNVASQINSESMKLQTDLTLGVKNQKAKDLITTPSMPGTNPGIPGPIKSISSMDPNYSNVDVLSQYLGHFKKAA